MNDGAALIVDDDEDLRRLVGAILRKHFDTVDTAADGEQAIAMLRSGSYDLVLLDVMLPKRNGFDVAAVIAELPGRPRIIVLSALARYFTDRFPADTVILQKPFDIDRLEEVLCAP